MATKSLTVRIDEKVLRRAREYADETGLKLYKVVESALRDAIPPKAAK